MTFEQLYYFSVTAEFLNFTKAAEILYISQPTLSRQIVMLEQELGVKLFNREYREVTLTEAGRVLRSECDLLLDRYQTIKKQVKQTNTGHQGSLSIACIDFYYPELFTTMREYCKTYPDVRFQMRCRDMDRSTADVANGKSDIGIGWSIELHNEPYDDFEFLSLYRDRFCAVMSDIHPLAQRPSLTVSEIKASRTIFLGRPKSYAVRQLMAKVGFDQIMERGFYAPDTIESLFLQLKASYRAIAIAPLSIIKEKGSGCAWTEISDWDSNIETVMFWRKDNCSPTVKNFTEMVRSRFANGPLDVLLHP